MKDDELGTFLKAYEEYFEGKRAYEDLPVLPDVPRPWTHTTTERTPGGSRITTMHLTEETKRGLSTDGARIPAPEQTMKSPKFAMVLSIVAFALSIFSIIFALTGCGDDLQPVRTWSDAEHAWSSAWCDHAAVCQPALYKSHFPDTAACLEYVYEDNCLPTGLADCTPVYPKPWYLIEECEADMTVLPCDIAEAPPSCYAAYAR